MGERLDQASFDFSVGRYLLDMVEEGVSTGIVGPPNAGFSNC
jgi:hypothetical protein